MKVVFFFDKKCTGYFSFRASTTALYTVPKSTISNFLYRSSSFLGCNSVSTMFSAKFVQRATATKVWKLCREGE